MMGTRVMDKLALPFWQRAEAGAWPMKNLRISNLPIGKFRLEGTPPLPFIGRRT